MQTLSLKKRQVAHAVAALALALGTGQALAAAFAVQTQSGSGLGNAYAGGAAAAEDASTVWSNPAGMARFSTVQIAVAANVIGPSFKLNNDGSLPALNQPLGGDGGDAGNLVGIPAMYIVVPINNQFAFGLGIGVPFGLETEWDDGWLGRYQGIHSKVETINVNPALSWKINDSFTLGAGVSYQHAKLKFTSAQNYGGALLGGCLANPQCAPFGTPVGAATYGYDASVNVDASDDSWGWNVGLMWNIGRDTRIGAHYRSSIKYDASGNVNIGLPTIAKTGNAQLDTVLAGLQAQAAANPLLQSGGVTSSIKVPSTTNVSFFSRINPQWEVMADVQFTNWSTIEYLTFTRTTGTVLNSTYENFKDVWRVSGGVNYYLDDKWKLRGGMAWDQSPVQDAERTPRLPDADRFWLAAGAQYTYQKNWKFDVGFAYEFVDSGTSNQNAGSTQQYGLIKGSYDVNAWLLGGQVSYSF
jgi:long-chain fatty acid transport protein